MASIGVPALKRARRVESDDDDDAKVLQLDLEIERSARRVMQQAVAELNEQIKALQLQLAQAEQRALEAECRADAAEAAEQLYLTQLTESAYGPQCSVCQECIEIDNDSLLLSCGHFLHTQCYSQLLEHEHLTCPVCRSSLV